MLTLDPRLSLIKELAGRCGTAADIGADHGYLIAALAQEGLIARGLACDLRPGPLSNAQALIARLGLEDIVETRLCDGLSAVKPCEPDVVMIAGMGGELIARILGDWDCGSAHARYLLSPMTRPETLRGWLWRHGFTLLRERCCIAAGRPYSVIEAVFTNTPREPSPGELYAGLADAGDAAGRAYLESTLARLRKKLGGLALADPDGRLPSLREAEATLLARLNA